jgi:hypothetical protein
LKGSKKIGYNNESTNGKRKKKVCKKMRCKLEWGKSLRGVDDPF